MPSAADSGPRRALVTGAAKRLGAAFALDLARRGWDLHIHYHTSETEARNLASRIADLGRRARLVRADLAAPGGAEELVEAVADTPPSLVIHSASSWIEDTLLTSAPDTWEASHRLHSWTVVVLARALARWPHPGESGHLVTLLDSRLRDRDPNHFSYAFAKREMALLTRYLAAELAPDVRVNGLAPGLILKAAGVPRDLWTRAGADSTPLGRTGKTGDLVRGLRYLVENPYVTGQILTVDGGRHLRGDLFGSL